jgi:hypothetical protein
MTRDEIISMAREAGFRTGSIELHSGAPLPFVAPVSATDCLPEVERLVSMAAAAERTAMARHFDVSLHNALRAEREACAQLVERNADVCGPNTMLCDVLRGNAAAIRALGE